MKKSINIEANKLKTSDDILKQLQVLTYFMKEISNNINFFRGVKTEIIYNNLKEKGIFEGGRVKLSREGIASNKNFQELVKKKEKRIWCVRDKRDVGTVKGIDINANGTVSVAVRWDESISCGRRGVEGQKFTEKGEDVDKGRDILYSINFITKM